jgi:hypothetical protein
MSDEPVRAGFETLCSYCLLRGCPRAKDRDAICEAAETARIEKLLELGGQPMTNAVLAMVAVKIGLRVGK